MIKKKAKGNTAGKKSGKKKNAAKKGKVPRPAEVRKDISLMVESEAGKMAQAVIDEGKKGQLATVKYLFEMASIFPPATERSEGTEEEDSLAKTLLHRLNLPEEPIRRDEDGVVVTPVVGAEKKTPEQATDADSGDSASGTEKSQTAEVAEDCGGG